MRPLSRHDVKVFFLVRARNTGDCGEYSRKCAIRRKSDVDKYHVNTIAHAQMVVFAAYAALYDVTIRKNKNGRFKKIRWNRMLELTQCTQRIVNMYSGQISYSRAIVCGPAAFSSWASCTRAHSAQHQWHRRSLKNVPCEEKSEYTIINITWVALYCRISNSSTWPFQPCWLLAVCVALRLTSIPFISRILPRITAPQ